MPIWEAGRRMDTQKQPEIKAGDRVEHAKYGGGSVTSIEDEAVAVTFDKGAPRRILASHLTAGQPKEFKVPRGLSKADGMILLEKIVANFGGTIDYPYVRGCTVAGQLCDPFINAIGGIGIATDTGLVYKRIDLARYVRMTVGMPTVPIAANDNSPIDPWANAASPKLPGGLLPETIEDFATIQADVMGVDPGGLAMSALTVCAAAIPDSITIQPKQHDPSWQESARIWTALIGNPSTKKTPVISAVTKPLKRLDRELFKSYAAAKTVYDRLSKDERAAQDAPKHVRLRLEDTTIEAAQEVLKDSPEGVLVLQDELSGFFGAIDKYSGGGRGAQKDRAFWLQAFNGGNYTVNRVGRGSSWIENLSVSLLGGIQPEPIRAVANDSQDDGLLQRLFPIVLRPATLGKDVAMPAVESTYDALIERLHGLRRPIQGGMLDVSIRFDAEGQEVWRKVTSRNFDLVQAWEPINKKLSSHIGKLDGLFARLCLIWHCIESTGTRPASTINGDTASRVADFMRDFLFPHAIAFYTDIIGLSDRQDALLATAGFILSHRPETFSIRDVQRGDATMRKLDKLAGEAVLEQLDAFRWLTPGPSVRRDSKVWSVNPYVYTLFEERAEEETYQRMVARDLIKDSIKLQS